MADQAKGKEDKEDGEDYSEVIEVLKQYIKSYKRVIASQSSNIKTLLLSLNTLKAFVEDSVSAIKNISSTLASLTNSSNTAATRKTSYSPRFDPFSGTMDLDSPPHPPRKEPYLGPAVNSVTSNLDPPIDIGSKEGFKDTITSSIVKELSKKAYTIPDDKNPDISNTYSDSNQAVLLMLLRNSLSSGPRAAISWIYIPSKAFKLLVRQYSRPIKSEKEDVYNEFHALTFSTYKKGLLAFNAEFNGYLTKLTMAKIDIDPSLILNQYFKALESKFPSWNPATEAYRAAHIANSSNSTPNSNSNPSKKGKNKKKGSYNLAIEEEEESDSSSNSMVEIPSNSIRKEDYRPIIEDAIVSEAIEPNKRYKLRNSPAKGTTLEGIGPSLRGKRPYRPTREPKPLTGTRDLPCVLREPVIEGNKVEKAISSPTLKEPNIEGELVDLDLDLEGAVSPDPSNLNTEKPISIEIGPSKLEPYESSSDKPIFAPKPIEVIAPNQPITNEPLDNSDLISEEDKMQLDYYKLLAKTSSYILSFVYKARKRVISKDSTPTTYKQVLKLPRDKRSKWLEAITKEFIQLLELGVFKFLPRSLLPSNCKLITCRNVLKVKKDAKNRPIKYKSRLVARGFMQVEGLDHTVTYASTSIPPTWRILLAIAASNKAIYKLLLKYGYNPSTPNIIKLSKALYDLGVFYNAKTCHFIVTYVDDCLFIGPDIGYITDLKKRFNKVYAIEDLGPAAYFLGVQIKRDRPNRRLWLNQPTKSHLNAAKNLFKYLNSTKDYSICFSYNGNTVADLGPKLSNSSNTTTKLSRDFYSKEGPRPLTTTSTTIVDSRNSKGSSRTSIINSSLVPIGFSDSDFAGDKATSKSTYGYLYKLAEAIREVQWIIGLFSELYRPIDYPITLYRDN
ncbi:hypothetical protein P8C59_003685 [Phyllachora maydis]|uniref:Reverse transcriptase Ty1/copia-type domain-containing protein n=1 Tax=Phyllachora maydis TaxID=1825666 RepID=A0AAD9MCN6_9PEZI|nr:hypothetical protein P8C59_003685 [Phyllachora maydis]